MINKHCYMFNTSDWNLMKGVLFSTALKCCIKHYCNLENKQGHFAHITCPSYFATDDRSERASFWTVIPKGHILGTKPIPEPMSTYCQRYPAEHFSVKVEL